MCHILVTPLVTVYLVEPEGAQRERTVHALKGLAASVVPLSSPSELSRLGPLAEPACVVLALEAVADLPILDFIGRVSAACPVVVIGTIDDLRRVVEVMRAGASNFLDLPCDGRRLRAAVREAIRRPARPASSAMRAADR